MEDIEFVYLLSMCNTKTYPKYLLLINNNIGEMK